MPNNIVAARNVLPAQGWQVSNVFGRELLLSDLGDLVELSREDPLFTWEREVMAPSYFDTLLHIRLKHYQQYGFGVHGIWSDGKFIGQCGLQVLDQELDRVECAIFLGKAFIHHGLGSMLVRHLASRCSECGMTALYGVVRPDNPESLALMRKLGGVPLGTVTHFNQHATIFRVNLASVTK